jgi:hypothetical protein
MESLLKKAATCADAAEAYSVTSEEVPVSFEANRLKRLETKRTTGRALRVIRQGRIGLAASTVIDGSGEDDLVRMPMSMLLGSGFILLVDDLARTVTASEIPISILTSAIGAPFFAYLLIKEGQKSAWR